MTLDTLSILDSGLATRDGAKSVVRFPKSPASVAPGTSAFSGRNRPSLRLGHVHLKVRELDRSLAFYCETLGLRLTERVGRYAFLALGTEHHSIALEEIGSWASPPTRRASGVAHVAFEVPDIAGFVVMRRALLTARVPLISRNNGISWTMRFRDPDGNEIEIYVDRRHAANGSRFWGGRWREPFRVEEAEAARIAAPAAAAVRRERESAWHPREGGRAERSESLRTEAVEMRAG